jgi:hypothetical protein
MNADEKKHRIRDLAAKLGGPEALNIINGILTLATAGSPGSSSGPSAEYLEKRINSIGDSVDDFMTTLQSKTEERVNLEVDRVRKEFGDFNKQLQSLASIVQAQTGRINKLENAKKKGARK